MMIFELIDKYIGLSPGEFRELMCKLPRKIQENFIVVLPSCHFRSFNRSDDNNVVLRTHEGLLPIVEIRDYEGLLSIPPAYTKIISRMDEIIQKEYEKSILKNNPILEFKRIMQS